MPHLTTSSLVEQYEELPALREKEGSAAWESQKQIAKEIALLLKKEPIIEEILASLDTQRVERAALDLTKRIPRDTDINRRIFLAEQRHTVANLAQLAFSLPIDYHISKISLDGDLDDPRMIDAIVIQPEFLSDKFLISAGMMTDHDHRLPEWKKIQRKIQAIPQVKRLLQALDPLRLGNNKSTGRIGRVAHPDERNFGKYLVFQGVSDSEEHPATGKQAEVRKAFVKMYEDVYSLMRSQEYALRSLKEKKAFLSLLSDDLISSYMIRWDEPGYTDEEKMWDIALLISMLEKKFSSNETRALKDRIEKIDLNHGERDRQRLAGSRNDLTKEKGEKIGKNTEIYRQLEWLRSAEEMNRLLFEHFYDAVIRGIPELNNVMWNLSIEELQAGWDLTKGQVNHLENFWRRVRNYSGMIEKTPPLGRPFHEIAWVVQGHLSGIDQQRQDNSGKMGLEVLKVTLSLILKLKKIRFEIITKEAEHRIKIRGNSMSRAERTRLQEKIQATIDSFKNTRFLPQVRLKESGQERFGKMIQSLQEVLDSLTP